MFICSYTPTKKLRTEFKLRRSKIIELLKKVNAPTRRKQIIELLKNSNWKKIVDDGFLLIYYNQYDEKYKHTILISCHIDSVFKDTDYFLDFPNSEIIKGTLDNSASIAILLSAMLDNQLPANIYVTFTEDEEQNMRGAHNTIDYFKRNLKEVWNKLSLVIVMDVSNKNWEKDVSIENFFIKRNVKNSGILTFKNTESFIKYITKILKKNKISYGIVREENAEEDESWTYEEYNLNVFSLCLPVWVDCEEDDNCNKRLCYNKTLLEHCIKGVITTQQKMRKTKDALIAICNYFITF